MRAVSLIRAVEHQLRAGLAILRPEEEYLREAIEEELHHVQLLLDKVAVEEALLRDREVLLSDPSPGLGEHLDDDSRPEE
jgi:hypothetical protein